MKVIVAGMPKTGTKTLAAALKELGYNVYDFLENYEYLQNDWIKIFTVGGSVDDFTHMYANVDAVTDVPCCFFWEEIHQAFPDAKIIFMQRENEDEWWNSFRNQLIASSHWTLKLMGYISPTSNSLDRYTAKAAYAVFGARFQQPLFGPIQLNELLCRMTYRRHNAYVLQAAPKDKLLSFKLKDGWEPLCAFLDVPIPTTPFPHKNKKGNIIDEFLLTNPTLIRCQREMYASTVALSLLLIYGMYKLTSKRSAILRCTRSSFRFICSRLGLKYL